MSDVVHNVMSRCVLENDHGLLNICELGLMVEASTSMLRSM